MEQKQISVPVGPKFRQTDKAEFERKLEKSTSRMGPKYTYFAHALCSGRIKIGRSAEPDERAEYISRQEREPVVIVALLRGGHIEQAYHKHFAEHRLHGEWFAPHPDILAEIERLNA